MSEETDVKAKRVFVITPIGAEQSPERLHADWILNAAIKPVFESAGYEVFRSDTIADPAMINDAIFNHIFEDEVCIADLSFTNANVYYELGVRHSLLKPVIHIAHSQVDRIPFDNSQHRAIFFTLNDYHSIERLKDGLKAQLATIEKNGFKVSNPITHARGRIEIAKSGDDKDKLISELLTRMEGMERQLRNGGIGVMSSIERITRGYPPNEFLPNEVRLQGSINRLTRKDQEWIRNLGIEIASFMDQHAGIPQADVEHNFYRIFGDRIHDLNEKDRDALGRFIQTIEGVRINYTLLRDLMNGINK